MTEEKDNPWSIINRPEFAVEEKDERPLADRLAEAAHKYFFAREGEDVDSCLNLGVMGFGEGEIFTVNGHALDLATAEEIEEIFAAARAVDETRARNAAEVAEAAKKKEADERESELERSRDPRFNPMIKLD